MNTARTCRSLAWFGTTFAIVCGAIWDYQPRSDRSERLSGIPTHTNRYDGRDLYLTDDERAIIGKAAIVHRRYHRDTREFFLTAIDGTGNRHAVHDPRYCFLGAGWKVIADSELAVPHGRAAWLKLIREEDRLDVLFWLSDGGTRHASFPRYWWQTTLRRLTFGRSGGEPVLMVVQSFGAEQPNWPEILPDLVEALNL
jgi:hypothetical protein